MRIAYFEPLARAWERMKGILWRPFDLSTWIVIGFSAWLAGLADGARGGGWKWIADQNDGSQVSLPFTHSGRWHELGESLLWLPVVFLVIMVVAAFLLLVLWLSSRGKFIFLDNVVHARAQIVEPWNRLRTLGDSLFLWRLGFVLVCGLIVLALLLLFFAPAATLHISDAVAGLSYAAMAMGGLVLVVFGLVAAYIGLFLEAFVIPIMYKFDLKATEAWRYFLPWLKSRPLPFLLYGLFVLLVFIGFGIVLGAMCVLTCCIVALPYVGTVLTLWFWVTYRLFSLEFLAQFDPGFDLFAPIELVAGE
jgi:hypothetical protein